MIVAVDTNIILDILLPDPNYRETSYNLIAKHMSTGRLIISECVYGELASQFRSEETLAGFLNEVDIKLVPSSPRSLWMAAEAWQEYTKVRNKALQCNKCGKKQLFRCPECNSIITTRQHILSDFLIAAHALAESDKLLTRDRGFYNTYFPQLKTE